MKPNPQFAVKKSRSKRMISLAAVLLASTSLLTACGGSSGGDNNSDSDTETTAFSTDDNTDRPLFSGTVSTPKGIAEPLIKLKSIDGTVTEVPVDEFGQFTLSNAQAGDQYLMRADLGNDNFIYSIAHLSDAAITRQNIHSYTDFVARSWFAVNGLDINSVFNSRAGMENFPDSEIIGAIDTNVQAIVSDVLQVYGLTDVTLANANYNANDTGIDRFLNENPVIIKDNRATIVVNDPNTNLQATAVDRAHLNTAFGETDTTPPEQPQNVRALGSKTDGDALATIDDAIVVAWSTARDDIGVATYEVYRDDNIIAHTPFPVYRDSSIEPDTDYIYTIITVDESGNRSIPSLQATGRTLSGIDTEPPAIPSSASLNSSTESIEVFWNHSNLSDLTRFEVTRVSEDGILVREVSGLLLNDITVASGTEYCYTVVAVDASNNRSESNPRACVTTSGAAVDTQPQTLVPATVEMAQETISSPEGSVITAYVSRVGDATGEVSIDYVITEGTAMAEVDFTASDGTLVWTDGDITAKQIDVSLLPDGITEGPETFSIALTNNSADTVISSALTTVTIVDID